MSELYLYGRKVESIFQLLGKKENNITYSVAYALANCRQLLQNFLEHVKAPSPDNLDGIEISLQTNEKDAGFTDIEIMRKDDFHYIVEAKRGWVFPGKWQLEKYASRPSFVNSPAKDKRIFVFNESTPEYTAAHFECPTNFNVEVIPWQSIGKMCRQAVRIGRDSENRLLRELNIYLNQISTMQAKDSNRVYVVSLGAGTPEGWSVSWRDVVNVKQRYFHPVGGGGTTGRWPAEPLNYIAFRYDGRLQSIHHIDKYEVFNDPTEHFTEIPKKDWGPHYLYHLGPAMKPACEVRTGARIVRSMRVWASLDLLLTSETIEEARDQTDLRVAGFQE